MAILKSLFLAAALALSTGMLSACTTLAPVYGDQSGVALANARFNFSPPQSRLEQLILNRLQIAFPAKAGPGDPTLDISATTSSLTASRSDAFAVARPVTVRVEAVVTIARGDETLFTATRFSDTAYQGGKISPVNLASGSGAEETAAKSVADSIRTAILAGYRPPADIFTPIKP